MFFCILEGIVTDDDLRNIGKAIASRWEQLGRRLPGIEDADIQDTEDRYTCKSLSKRGYHILKRWKRNKEEAADYKTLHDALGHSLVMRRDLAEKYCYEK